MPEVLHTYGVRILNNNGKTGVVYLSAGRNSAFTHHYAPTEALTEVQVEELLNERKQLPAGSPLRQAKVLRQLNCKVYWSEGGIILS